MSSELPILQQQVEIQGNSPAPAAPAAVIPQVVESPKEKDAEIIGFSKFNKDFSKSMMSIFDEIYDKPESTTWVTYIVHVCTKENRPSYIGVLLIIMILCFILVL